MSSMPKIRVVPVRGSDWVMSDRSFSSPPDPFIVALQTSEASHWAGIILDSGHMFEGQRVDLSVRQTVNAGEVEVAIGSCEDRQEITLGWAVLDPPLRTA